MFKGGKNTKQTKQPKRNGGAAFMAEMGISMPNFDDPNFGADGGEDDADLAAELEMLEQGAGGPAKKRPKDMKKKPAASTQDLQSFHNDVNKLLSDIDRPINDEDLSDVDEAELLGELQEMTGEIEFEEQKEQIQTKPVQSTSDGGIVSVLETRLGMYKKAVETAKASGDAAKARRYDRQYKIIQELLQTARAGRPINESEIPPAIGVTATSSAQPEDISQPLSTRAPSPPPRPTSVTSLPKNDLPVVSEPSTSAASSNNSDEAIARLRSLALQARAEGDMAKAHEYVTQIKNLRGGAITNSAPVPPQPSLPVSTQAATDANVPEDENSASAAMPLIAPEPRTVMEALQQRYEELSKRHKEAVTKGETAKARRMDRLTKQYQEAIEATRKGRPYDYSELAELPGFAPIPVQQSKPQPPPPSSTTTTPAPMKPTQSTAQARPTQSQLQQPIPRNGSFPQLATKASIDPQVQSLRRKQEQLRKLALEAREKGDLETAKKYLLESKKLEQTIASAETGPLVDTHHASESPTEDYDTVHDEDLTEEVSKSSRETIYRRLQEDLLRQVLLCARNQQMYAQMEGSNSSIQAKEFKALELRCARDLERLKQCFQNGSKPPIFHYEKRQMNIIQVNNDLTDDDFEVNVLRGINLQVPSGYSPTTLQTYVIIEFPYPADTVQTARTRPTTGSINAEYPDSLHRFPIKRADNKFKRFINRKEIKLSIFYKAGFLRQDRQLGIAFIKLTGLEQSATIHESVDVYENDHRKKAEGKLEVKIRIKEAIGPTKSSELLPQRWLVIDRFEEIGSNSKPSAAHLLSKANSSTNVNKQTSSICTCL
jgi:coiled-coil and C2 domain-containing protein 1